MSSVPTFVKNFHDEDDLRKMKYSSLGETGMMVSNLGFGGSQLMHVYETAREQEGLDIVKKALEKGINYIDTAPWYGFGTAEIVLGKALKDIPRNAYYVATKVGRYKPDYLEMFDFSAERTIQSVDESLQKLGLDYVDVIQVHDLEFAPDIDVILHETLPALQKVKNSGKAKFIGITGYPLKTLKEVVEKSSVPIDVVLSYCRCTLWDSSLNEYLPFFEDRGIGVVNAAVLGMNLLTNFELPTWHPATPEIKSACARAVQHCKDKNVDISKLAIRHALSQPKIHTNLVGVYNMQHLESNINIVGSQLNALEKDVMQNIINKFFNPLSVTHWEDVELVKYRRKLREAQNSLASQ